LGFVQSIHRNGQRLREPIRITRTLEHHGGVAVGAALDEAQEYLVQALEEVKPVKPLMLLPTSMLSSPGSRLDRKQEQAAREKLGEALQMYRQLGMASKIRDIEELVLNYLN